MNQFNIELMQGLELYLQAFNRSPITIKGYLSDLNIFFRWVADNLGDKRFVDLKKADLNAFVRAQRANGCHGKRIQRFKASIQNIGDYVFCELDDEFPNFHPLHSVIKVSDTKNIKPPVIYSTEEVQNMLNRLVEFGEYRCALYVALGVYSGLRKSEIQKVDESWFVDSNLAQETNYLYYRSPYPIHTKGSPDRKQEVYIKREIQEYLPYFKYVNKNNGNTMEYDANKIKKLVDKRFHWHALRHFFVTDWLRKGMPPEVLVKIIGWRDMAMIKVYDDMTRAEHISNYFNGGGNNGIN